MCVGGVCVCVCRWCVCVCVCVGGVCVCVCRWCVCVCVQMNKNTKVKCRQNLANFFTCKSSIFTKDEKTLPINYYFTCESKTA